MIKTINDVNLISDVFNYDVILVPMSLNNSMSKGFKYEIGLHFPYVKEQQQYSPYGDKRKYGTINPIESDGIIFCLCYMYGTLYNIKSGKKDTVNYVALTHCLEEIKRKYANKRIASVVMGDSLYDGNGDKSKIISIFDSVFKDVDITLYDYEQPDYVKDRFVEIAILHKRMKDKELTPKEYIKLRSEVEWRRRYGIFKPMPENYKYIPRKGEIKKENDSKD